MTELQEVWQEYNDRQVELAAETQLAAETLAKLNRIDDNCRVLREQVNQAWQQLTALRRAEEESAGVTNV